MSKTQKVVVSVAVLAAALYVGFLVGHVRGQYVYMKVSREVLKAQMERCY